MTEEENQALWNRECDFYDLFGVFQSDLFGRKLKLPLYLLGKYPDLELVPVYYLMRYGENATPMLIMENLLDKGYHEKSHTFTWHQIESIIGFFVIEFSFMYTFVNFKTMHVILKIILYC